MASSPAQHWVSMVSAAALPGDHIVCMSNGGFGGIHDRLLKALNA